jgi:hypothetical protein
MLKRKGKKKNGIRKTIYSLLLFKPRYARGFKTGVVPFFHGNGGAIGIVSTLKERTRNLINAL